MRIKDVAVQALQRSSLLHDVYVKVRFPVERQLLEGTHVPSSSHPSIIHFSTNRAATQYVKRILRRLAKENGLTHADLSEYAFSNDMPFFDHMSVEEMQNYAHMFKPTGYLYSHFGGYVYGIRDLDKFLVALVIRDPRDTLTSRYYSKAFSHRLPDRADKAAVFQAERDQVRQMTVDEFVLREMDRYCGRYRAYMSELDNRPNVLLTRYEDLVGDFPQWLDQVVDFCALTISPATKAKLLSEADGSSDTKENKMKHKRQVTPGDHRRKLQPETIARLNDDLADILTRYGYETAVP